MNKFNQDRDNSPSQKYNFNQTTTEMNHSQLNIHRCDPCEDQIEEEIGSQQETPQINAISKPNGKKPSILQPTQHSPVFCIAESGASPLRYPVDQTNDIEENIANPNDTTNGAQ